MSTITAESSLDDILKAWDDERVAKMDGTEYACAVCSRDLRGLPSFVLEVDDHVGDYCGHVRLCGPACGRRIQWVTFARRVLL
jgi:hypothetical protein